MSEDVKKTALHEFHRIDAALIAAMNGIGRPVGTQEEIIELRRSLIHARHECEALGLDVETVWEKIQKRRKEDERRVRRFAEDQACVTPMITAENRRLAAKGVGFVIAIGIILHWPGIGGSISAVIAGLAVYAIVESLVAEHFPTPPIRVARMACECDVDVSDLWPESSQAYKDYVDAYSRHQMRLSLRGRPMGWIKAR